MSLNEHRSGAKLRLWCGKHQGPLENFEDSGLMGWPVWDKPVEPNTGVWEIDLSDFMCPQEITSWDPEYVAPYDAWRIIANDDPRRSPIVSGSTQWFNSEKDAKRRADKMDLDECVQTWEVQFWAPEVDDTEGDSWIRAS